MSTLPHLTKPRPAPRSRRGPVTFPGPRNLGVSLLAAGLLLGACSQIPPKAYYNRGDPENLLDVSLEAVNLTLSSNNSVGELADAIRKDPPSRAELHCQPEDPLCLQAKSLFDRRGIPVRYTGNPADHAVTLLYQRVVARDCQNRYLDNSSNPYNLPPPTFGCSVTANTVQMVSDRRQFVSPSLLDYPDSQKSVQNYTNYEKPSAPPSPQAGTMQIYPAATNPAD